uniref:Sugar kinases, ribokinase family n=1 Tax=uncultured Oceanospirillales bacterium HF0130_25G24 TaxID=710744 RepID=E0XTI7_9GAMM|nr:sugar kinases, ribokinase family [uncultured Oceanospirillales bacterium HF0130_25G24]
MKKYDVYGIGNALVDTEFEVTEDFLKEQGIEKGCMTLLDRKGHQSLSKTLRQRYEVKTQSGGGSAGNSMYALTQFGGKAFYSCKVANDHVGEYFLKELGHNNIKTSRHLKNTGISGQCLIMVTPDAERTMNTYLGVSADLSINEIDFEAAKKSEYVYIEGFLVSSDSARKAIMELINCARNSDVKIALTFSDPAVVTHFKDAIDDVLTGGVDLLFCNEEELKIWANSQNFEEACSKMSTVAKQFAVTRGANGATLFDGSEYISIAPQRVTAVNTNGAGDMFAGAFLYGITQNFDFREAGNFASLASAQVVTQFGPRLKSIKHSELRVKLLKG